MRKLITILITTFLAWLVTSAFPWWTIAVIPFLVAVVWKLKPGFGFVNGFVSICILWTVFILKTDAANEQILSDKMAQLFGLRHGLFLVVNVFLGALVGGLGGWSGAAMRKMFKNPQ